MDIQHHHIKFTIFTIAMTYLAVFLAPNLAQSALFGDNLVNLINVQRKQYNLAQLQTNPLLNKAADLKADALLKENDFAHTLNNGKEFYQFLDEVSYHYLYAGENLAMDFGNEDGVVTAFMASPTHRANVLKPEFQEIGIATKDGIINNHYTTLAVVIFGTNSDKIYTPGQTIKSNLVSQGLGSASRLIGIYIADYVLYLPIIAFAVFFLLYIIKILRWRGHQLAHHRVRI